MVIDHKQGDIKISSSIFKNNMITGNFGLLIIETNTLILEDSEFLGGSTNYYQMKSNLRGGFIKC